MTTLFVNRLTTIDASCLDWECGLVGESWIVDVELEGELDQQGMVLDFSEVKRWIKQSIDQHFDHKLLLPTRDPGLQVDSDQSRTTVTFKLASGLTIKHCSPETAIATIDAARVDADTLGLAITTLLQQEMATNISSLQIKLFHETTPYPAFRYSHGLKQHSGNCQRIAHGHRSSVEIERDGQREPALEAAWAERWHDIYIGSSSDLLARFKQHGISYYRFGYSSSEGRFELELPAQSCYLIEGESTVETLACHLANLLRQKHPDSSFKVRIFEGVGKGAISRG